jgi:internalin A
MTPEQAHAEALRRIDFAAQTGQHWLDLGDLPLRRLPNEIARLAGHLTELGLNEWAYDPKTLKWRYGVDRWHGLLILDDLQPMAELAGLRVLSANLSGGTKGLGAIGAFVELESLRLNSFGSFSDLRPLSRLTRLKTLMLSGCEQISDFAPLRTLGGLESLGLYGAPHLEDLSPLRYLHGLRSLFLSGPKKLTELAPLSVLENLTELFLYGCEQLDSLEPISKLSSLNRLDLVGASRLSTLRALADLQSLESLHLSNAVLIDELTPLSVLHRLKSLDVRWCRCVSDLTSLCGLHRLERLGLAGMPFLRDLQPVFDLSGLRSLEISACETLIAIDPLANLQQLEQLSLRSCAGIADLQPLAALDHLEHFDLSGNHWISHLDGLAPLVRLKTLKLDDLDSCSGFQGLHHLRALETLRLSRLSKLRDLHFLSGLEAVELIGISMCSNLRDIRALSGMERLRSLYIISCDDIGDCSALFTLSRFESLSILNCGQHLNLDPGRIDTAWPQLSTLVLDQLNGAPDEILSSEYGENCLQRMLHWWDDLQQGEAESQEIKLFILGNGRVGKTQLFRRLHGRDYDPMQPSTHGVQLGRFEIMRDAQQRPVYLNVWDFGGQDIYLGTHALFMQSRAIFLLAWHPDHESDAPYTEALSGMPMRHRTLDYWLDYIHSLAGAETPIIVAQTRCERERDAATPRIANAERFAWLKPTITCASRDDGIDELRNLLKRGARYRLEQHAPRLPANWLRIRDRLGALRASEKAIDLASFERLCAEIDARANASALLHYLHRAGEVFHRAGLFHDAIVLDQQWALDAIYALLEREGLFPLLHAQGGVFAPGLLGMAVWDAHYSPQEQALLRSMMESCDLIFAVHCQEEQPERYAMPDALPQLPKVAEQLRGLWPEAAADASATLQYDFLHDGILRRFLGQIGRIAGSHGLYWRYGCSFYDGRTRSRAKIETRTEANGSGVVEIQAIGPEARQLCAQLIELFKNIRIGEPPKVEGEADALQATTKNASEGIPDPKALQPAPAPLLPDQQPVVYFSYAWGGKDRPELKDFAVQLHRSLEPDYHVRRDEEATRHGDRLSDFMREIGRGARVLVLLSDHYLRSPYCMQELLHLYHHHLADDQHMRRHILPLVVDRDFRCGAEQRIGYVRYWKDEVARLKRLIEGLEPSECMSVILEIETIKGFVNMTDRMLAFMNDVLMPRGMDCIAEGDFSAVRAALAELGAY